MLTDLFELSVALDELTNLELLKKGLYRVAVSVSCSTDNGFPSPSQGPSPTIYHASPTSFAASPPKITSESRGVHCDESDQGSEMQYVDEATKSYTSRSIFCRYVDESFCLGEIATFSLAVPSLAFPTTDAASSDSGHGGADGDANSLVTVRFKLLRAEFGYEPVAADGTAAGSGSGGKDGNKKPVVALQQPPVPGAKRQLLSPFTDCCTAEVAFPLKQLRAGSGSLQAYVPVVFDSLHLCVLGVSLFGVLQGRKFNPPHPSLFARANALLRDPTASAFTSSPHDASPASGSYGYDGIADDGHGGAGGGGADSEGEGSGGSGLFSSRFRKFTGKLFSAFTGEDKDSTNGSPSASGSHALTGYRRGGGRRASRTSPSPSSSLSASPSRNHHNHHHHHSRRSSTGGTAASGDPIASTFLELPARTLAEVVFPRWRSHQQEALIAEARVREAQRFNVATMTTQLQHTTNNPLQPHQQLAVPPSLTGAVAAAPVPAAKTGVSKSPVPSSGLPPRPSARLQVPSLPSVSTASSSLFRLRVHEVQAAHSALISPLLHAHDSLVIYLMAMWACVPDAVTLSNPGSTSRASRSSTHGSARRGSRVGAEGHVPSTSSSVAEGINGGPGRFTYHTRRAAHLMLAIREAASAAAERHHQQQQQYHANPFGDKQQPTLSTSSLVAAKDSYYASVIALVRRSLLEATAAGGAVYTLKSSNPSHHHGQHPHLGGAGKDDSHDGASVSLSPAAPTVACSAVALAPSSLASMTQDGLNEVKAAAAAAEAASSAAHHAHNAPSAAIIASPPGRAGGRGSRSGSLDIGPPSAASSSPPRSPISLSLVHATNADLHAKDAFGCSLATAAARYLFAPSSASHSPVGSAAHSRGSEPEGLDAVASELTSNDTGSASKASVGPDCLPFACRVLPLIQAMDSMGGGAEAVAEALRIEADRVSDQINAHLRSLVRCLLSKREAVLRPLQAMYLASATADVASRLKTRVCPPSCLVDPDASAPLLSTTGLPRSIKRSQVTTSFVMDAASTAFRSSHGIVSAAPISSSSRPSRANSVIDSAPGSRRNSTAGSGGGEIVMSTGLPASSSSGSTIVRKDALQLLLAAQAPSSLHTSATSSSSAASSASSSSQERIRYLLPLVAAKLLQGAEVNPLDMVLTDHARVLSITEYCYTSTIPTVPASNKVMPSAPAERPPVVPVDGAEDVYSDDGEDGDELGLSPSPHGRDGASNKSRKSNGSAGRGGAGFRVSPTNKGAHAARSTEATNGTAGAVASADDGDISGEVGLSVSRRRAENAGSADSGRPTSSDALSFFAHFLVRAMQASNGGQKASIRRALMRHAALSAPGHGHSNPFSSLFLSLLQGSSASTALTAAAGQLSPPFDPGLRLLKMGGKPTPLPKVHVVIFLNGLGGSTHDTRVLRSYLKLMHPHLYCYVCTSNQGKETEGNLIEAGDRVAREIFFLLQERVPFEDGFEVHKVSFVAFSLGGIVARLALRHPLLKPFLPYCHAFVSVASPHLGLLYSQSSIVSAGIFVFRNWKKSQSLAQLSLSDETPPADSPEVGIRNCLIYLLACGWERTTKSPFAAAVRPLPLSPHADSSAAAASSSLTDKAAASLTHLTLRTMEHDPMLPSHKGDGRNLRIGPEVDDVDADKDGLAPTEDDVSTTSPSPLAGNHSSSASASPELADEDDDEDSGLRTPVGHHAIQHSGGKGSHLAAALMAMDEGGRRGSTSLGIGPTGAAAAAVQPQYNSSNATAAGASSASGSAARQPLNATLQLLKKHGFSSEPNGRSLANFRHVVVMGSEQDSYAPAASCAAQLCDAALKDATNGAAYNEMVKGFWSGVDPERVRRWDVDFRTLSSILSGRVTLDGVLGREAHISFLETPQLSLALALHLSEVWDTSLFSKRGGITSPASSRTTARDPVYSKSSQFSASSSSPPDTNSSWNDSGDDDDDDDEDEGGSSLYA